MLFAACAAIGHAPSLIGQIAPNGLRGQVSAIFLFVLNVIGTGVGPFAVAMLTDHVFADPKMVGISMTITALTGAVVGAILLWAGSGAVRQSAERLAVAVEGEIR
jgi:MFS family permease